MEPLDWTGFGKQSPWQHPCDTCNGELGEACHGCEYYEKDEDDE
jgi:hypothetical protein